MHTKKHRKNLLAVYCLTDAVHKHQHVLLQQPRLINILEVVNVTKSEDRVGCALLGGEGY